MLARTPLIAASLLLFLSVPANAAAPEAKPPTMKAHFIDVGQADATLLEFPCGAILIDAGAESQKDADTQRLTGYLDSFFKRRKDLNKTLAAVYITHNHKDHTNALAAVAKKYAVQRVIHNGRSSDSGAKPVADLESSGVRVVAVDDSLVLGPDGRNTAGYTSGDVDPIDCSAQGIDPRITILSASLETNPGWSEEDFGNANNHSLVVRVDYGSEESFAAGDFQKVASFLFTGDLEEPAIDMLVDWYKDARLLDVDVYQVGHHGSANGTTWGLLDAMSPMVSVASAGKCWNGADKAGGFNTYAYRHPREGVIAELNGKTRLKRTAGPANVIVGLDRTVHDVRFGSMVVTQAVYSTSWDGTVVIGATYRGWLDVESDTADEPDPSSTEAEACFAPSK